LRARNRHEPLSLSTTRLGETVMREESSFRQRTATRVLLLALIVAVVAPKSTHAQCTRSCGGQPPPPNDGFSVLHNFTGPPDGAGSTAGLVEDSAGNLYGTTSQGGITGGACGDAGCGIVFKVDQSGNQTVLHSFAGQPDGATPLAGLLLDAAGNMYGTTSLGGTANLGTVFKLDSTGTETVLYSFTGEPDGAGPAADLVFDAAGNLLSTTSAGGLANKGTVFKLDSTGKESALYSFTGGSDGSTPMAGLVLDAEGNMYGTTIAGGAASCKLPKRGRSTISPTCGVVFELDKTGIESVLYSFTGEPDGARPAGDLARDAAGNLYGSTIAGGTPCISIAPPFPGQGPVTQYDCGTIFKVHPTGGETLLHTFSGAPDGAIPYGGLILDAAGNLYGTTSQGGEGSCIVTSGLGSEDLGCGSVFEVEAAGNAVVLYSFTGTGLDWAPKSRLILDPSGNVFGTTTQGGVTGGECGDFGCGVVFSVAVNVNRPAADAPTFSPPGGTYNSVQTVAISDATANAAIYYTTDGSTPTTSSTRYEAAITVNSSETIQAIAAAAGFSNSPVASAEYTISTSDFSLTSASGSLTVASGGQKTDVITIAPLNGAFASPIQLTCAVAGPSPLPSCSFTPSSVTLGADAATSTLTITAPMAAATRTPSPRQPNQVRAFTFAAWIPLTLVLAAAGRSKKSRRGFWTLSGSFVLLLVLQSACGGTGGPTTSQTNYTITVTATSGAIQHSTQVGVTLQ
jgi:uncharacterized repeat protein (TIGR03803 family)